nr:reverse transcriptase domain-containing protein [Tanacetum cinerariifolium]
MANTTPLVTTVMKPTNDPGEANTALRVNIQELCEEYYEDILPIIMEKARHERLKDVHARLDFGEEVNPFTPRIRNFESLRKARMPNNIKTYDGTGDPEDHVKIFQAAAQVERSAMPTWCHMFNSTLIGAARVWFDELPPESIDGYKDTKAAFLSYFMQQKKYVRDLVEIHNIKQWDGETLEDFMERFKIETGRMKGTPKCMRISRFMHRINNPELTKRLNEHVPKTMEEMMIATTAFICGEAAAASKKKGHMSWKPQDQSKKHTDKRPDFRGHSRDSRGANQFTPLTRTPKEILAAEANKFQPPPPMVTPVEKRNSNKFCDFHNDKGHNTDECMQLKKQIEELVRAGKLSHLIKEMKQGQEPPKTGRKEVAAKDKPTTIYMDCYPLPEIDWKVESLSADEEKTSFHTGQGVYCYTKMPFGLKNAGATYQRLMDKAFESQMGRNIEVYVDDLVIKSHTEAKMCSPDDRTGDGPDASLLHKSCVTGSRTKLLIDGKTGFITSLCSKKTSEIFLGTSYHDFLNEMSSNASQGVLVVETQEEPWTLFTDGSSCVDGSGAGLILTNPDGVEFTYAMRFQFAASNNEAEYEALIAGLRIATQMGVKNIQKNVDSKLVANQVLGAYVAKEDNMIKYLEITKGLVSGFKTFSISQVPRSRNKKADALSKIASTSFTHLSKQVLVEELETKSITRKEVTAVIEEEGPT